jgi:hypothetical protein
LKKDGDIYSGDLTSEGIKEMATFAAARVAAAAGDGNAPIRQVSAARLYSG